MFYTKLITLIYFLCRPLPKQLLQYISFISIGFLVYAVFLKLCFFLWVVEKCLLLNVVNFNYIFLQSFQTHFYCTPDFKQIILNIRCKWLMTSKFSLLCGKPNKALCGEFYRRSISEFNNTCNLDQREFDWRQQ